MNNNNVSYPQKAQFTPLFLVRLLLSSLTLWTLYGTIALGQSPQRFSDPDEPWEEENLNRELWESQKKTPYSELQPYLQRSQEQARTTIPTEVRLPNGWKIAPVGDTIDVGNLPYEAVSYAGKILVLNTGFYGKEGQEISIVDPKTRQVIKTLRFPSLFPSAQVGLDGDLYISGGMNGKIYRLNSQLETVREYAIPGYTAGITAIDADHLGVVTLVTEDKKGEKGKTEYRQGQLILLNTQTGIVEKSLTVGHFPYGIMAFNRKLYLTLLGENKLLVFDHRLNPLKTLGVGHKPQTLCRDSNHLYVVNTTSDSLSVINPQNDTIVGNILLANLRVGSSPTSCAVVDHRLYVTQANLNAVSVFDLKTQQKVGMIPTAWYPTKVLFDQGQMAVLSAKGIRPRRPNPPGQQPSYVLALLKGSLSLVPQTQINPNLAQWTTQVEEGSPLYSPKEGFKLPIRHIFYIIKENRTYDQILGDLGKGNGDPSLTLFGKNITPNHHQIASQFVTLDNFFANGEVSVLGHSYTTSGYTSPFVEWLANTHYSGRYKSYPFGIVPATFSPLYLWNALEAKGVNYRIYGEPYYIFTRAYQLIVERYGADSQLAQKFYQQSTHLANNTDRGNRFSKVLQSHYGQADTLEGVEKLLKTPAFVEVLSQMLTGDNSLAKALAQDRVFSQQFARFLLNFPFNYHSWDLSYSDLQRFQDWRVEFDKQVQENRVPGLSYIWLPNDHTEGEKTDIRTPSQFVAQNDAALGLIVQTISHSPIWSNSLILVVEDDAQSGPDHVDATRTVSLAIGPYIKRGEVISDRYDQLSLLRTIELLLGLDPLNQNDALAVPMFNVFQMTPDLTPYQATPPSSELAEADQELYRVIKKRWPH